MRCLDAQETFSDYPFANELTKRLLLSQSQNHERFVRDFIHTMDTLYPNSGFRRVGFAFFNTDVPNAVTFHVEVDDSYAIGLDYGSVSLFAFTFPTLLYSRLNNLENLEWVTALLDIIQIQLLEDDGSSKQRSMRRLMREHELEAVSSRALEMTFRFVIGHELAHYHLQHFRNKRATRLNTIGTGTPQDRVSTFDPNSEFEADAWAADALLKFARDNPLKHTLARYIPGLMFGVQSLAWAIYEPRTSLGRHVKDSHPDPWQRAQRLLPQNQQAERSPDPVIQAISDLPGVIAQERGNTAFKAAAAHVRGQILSRRQLLVRQHRPWWRFWS